MPARPFGERSTVYNRVIIKGSAPGGEVWTSGFALHSPSDNVPATTPELELMAQNIGVIIGTWSSTNQLRRCLSNTLSVVAVRVECRNEDESLFNLGEKPLVPPLQGSLPLTHSLQSAAVVSLRTLTPGGHGRGRMFWPNLTYVPTQAGRIDNTLCIALASDMRTFLNEVLDSVDPGFDLFLAVRSVTDHMNRVVTSLRVGDVPDTQRRRRDALVEVYSSVPFP